MRWRSCGAWSAGRSPSSRRRSRRRPSSASTSSTSGPWRSRRTGYSPTRNVRIARRAFPKYRLRAPRPSERADRGILRCPSGGRDSKRASQEERRRGDLTESIVEEARRSKELSQPAECRRGYWDRLNIQEPRMTGWADSPYTGIFTRFGRIAPRPHDPEVPLWSGALAPWGPRREELAV